MAEQIGNKMNIGGMYRPLNEEQIEKIHNASLYVLEDIGFTYEKGIEDVLLLLEKAGAGVDNSKARITLPRNLVMEQISKTPEKVVLYSRDGGNDLNLQKDNVYMGTGGAAIKILDLETGKVRKPLLRDLYLLGRLVDQLPNIRFFLRPCIPHDILSEKEYDVNVYYTCMKATTKHVMGAVNDVDNLNKVIELASMIAGSKEMLQQKPFISVVTSFAISPLKLSTQPTLIMQEACRQKIPVALSSAPAAGSTAPLPMAGTLVQLHAEELAGITIAQLTNPGAPVIYGGIPGVSDLRTMGYVGGSVECGMMNAAIHQLARYIKVPNYNSSALTDSKVPDAQAGWEKGLTSILVSMGGSNYVHHAAGMLESMLTISYEQYVMDDEIIGMCMRVLRGIEVDEEHLALKDIEEVGPGGNYLVSPGTIAFMRGEYYSGNGISDRNNRDIWEKEGALDARERAKKIAEKLIINEKTNYIPKDVDDSIRERFKILLPE